MFDFLLSFSLSCHLYTGIEGKLCSSSWSFEKVNGYELRKYERKRLNGTSKVECLESCLLETSFKCRSVNYDNTTGDCSLSDIDRHAIPTKPPRKEFAPSLISPSTVAYYESNCIEGKRITRKTNY